MPLAVKTMHVLPRERDYSKLIIGPTVAQIWLFCTMNRSFLDWFSITLYWWVIGHIFRFAQSIIQILFSKHNMFSREIQYIITKQEMTQRREHRILKHIWRNQLSNDYI